MKEEESPMSANELDTLTQQFAESFNNKNFAPVFDMLADDLEVFDHVPYRFDNKAQFAAYLSGAAEGIASMSFRFHQPSYRLFNDTTGIMNAYDSFSGVTKDGKVLTIHGRTTLVFVKHGAKWKIVSAHFSSVPHTP
jgi:ketosteroid isomerase-like protein